MEDCSLNHLVRAFLSQKLWGAHAEGAFPSLFLVQEAGEAAAKVEIQPGKQLPFSQLPFLLVSF